MSNPAKLSSMFPVRRGSACAPTDPPVHSSSVPGTIWPWHWSALAVGLGEAPAACSGYWYVNVQHSGSLLQPNLQSSWISVPYLAPQDTESATADAVWAQTSKMSIKKYEYQSCTELMPVFVGSTNPNTWSGAWVILREITLVWNWVQLRLKSQKKVRNRIQVRFPS